MSYEHLFDLFQAFVRHPGDKSEKDALIFALVPYVERWAADVLMGSPQRVKHNEHENLVQEGLRALTERLETLVHPSIEDGKHLVDMLRLSVEQAMTRALHRRFVVPFPTPETIGNRLKKGKPAYKSWELRKQVDLEEASTQRRINLTNRETPIDRRFLYYEDGLQESYDQFLDLVAKAAIALSQKWDWLPYVEYLYGTQLSVTKVAEWTGTPESTLRGRLRRLGRELAATAPYSVFCDGQKFLGKRWAAAAKNDPGWQRNSRGTDLWTPWLQLITVAGNVRFAA